MYIKSLILDGFKSYRNEVVLDRFDRQFNAITGSNGSGKSNILDAVCFVLGENNLSKARVNAMSELIYENGRSHVQKATVTIKFNNEAKDESPIGYEEFEEVTVTRQITLDGRCNYLINGRKSPSKKVMELFASIKLNIHNPHFLVMQGHVTKMISMKPKEIISMIEEAIGTAYCQRKSIRCDKSIAKKNERIEQLEQMLKELILPKMQKLRKNYDNHLMLKRTEQEYERCEKVLTFLSLKFSKDHIEKLRVELVKLQTVLDEKMRIIAGLRTQIDQKNAEINELESRQTMSQDKTELESLKNAYEEEKNKHLELKQRYEELKDSLESKEIEAAEMEKQIRALETSVKSKENELEEFDRNYTDKVNAHKKMLDEQSEAKKKYDNLTTGAENEASDKAKRIETQNKLSCVVQDLETKQMRFEYLRKENENSNRSKRSFDQIQNEISSLEKEKLTMEAELANVQNKEQHLLDSLQRKRSVADKLGPANDKLQAFYRKYPLANFRYSRPPNSREFKDSDVKGIVAKLFRSKDAKFQVALQAAAGAKLYNVVVEDKNTSKLILKYGQLSQRCTFIPLRETRTQIMSQKIVDHAYCNYDDTLWPAMSLIEFDESVRTAMEFVFGNVFICKNIQVARNAAYDRNISRKCVTLDGDFVDPQGVLYGGSSQQTTNVLAEMQAILDIENFVKNSKAELKNCEDLEKCYVEEKENLNVLQSRLQAVLNQLQSLNLEVAFDENLKSSQEMSDLKNDIALLEESKKKFTDDLAKLTVQLNDPNFANQQILKTKEVIERLSKAIEKNVNAFEEIEKEKNLKVLEIKNWTDKLIELKQQLDDRSSILNELREKFESKCTILKESQKRFKDLEKQYEDFREKVFSKDEKRMKIITKKTSLEQKVSEIEIDVNQLNVTVRKKESEKQAFTSKFDEREYIELAKDNSVLERVNETTNRKDLDSIEEEKRTLKDRKEKLKRNVNVDEIKLYENELKHEDTVKKKLSTLIDDRNALQNSIEKLHEARLKSVNDSWKIINDSFGSIFKSLLPGGNAQLSPVNRLCVLDGFEIKIGFGLAWKDDLTEISGGQRSLLALSLLLAVLSYKAAPFYVLDEIDAALDLSNTENFGVMLKNHFKNSQFLIVSHKDQMFNNANVRFHVNFENSSSKITRTSK